MLRRSLRAALVLLSAAAVFAGMSSAFADPFVPGPGTSVVVTRLTVTAGKGWLVLQPRIDDNTTLGFEVTIPAGDGAWSGSPRVDVPDMGIACVRKVETDLDYLCGSDDPYSDPQPIALPRGGYQISIPVTRTGPVDGLIGSTSFWADNPSYGGVPYSSDTFPVVDGTQFRSTAEVRTLNMGLLTPSIGYDRGDIAVTMTAVPGEVVHSVDIQLPPAAWRLLDYQLHPKVDCQLLGGAIAPVIHCAPILPSNNFPTGRYPFVIKVGLPQAEDSSSGQTATVALGVNGAEPVIQDTFPWISPFVY